MTKLARQVGHTGGVRDNLSESAVHVVHGVLSLDVGGLERIVLDLVREGVRREQRVSVVCLERPGVLAGEVEAAGARVHSLGKPRGKSRITIQRAVEVFGRLQPDVLHTHQVGALWHLGQAAGHVSLPVVHTEHSDQVLLARGFVAQLKARLMWRRVAALADRFCCVSEDIARSARRWATVPRQKIEVVPNGIDVTAFTAPASVADIRLSLGIPAGALVVGSVGRLVEVKRHDLLIEAFADLQERGRLNNTWLLIVGDGPERDRLQRLAADFGVGELTIFAGYQAEPERLLRAMDLFALTSRHEGLPLALLEAWAAGVPVVASSVGAIPQTVVHGVSGMLFPSGDRESLVTTLETLLESPSLMGQLGRRGQARAQHRYSLTRMADDYERCYRSVLPTSRAKLP
jgi:glycosyltransferase involved in cell wall biosynthesis